MIQKWLVRITDMQGRSEDIIATANVASAAINGSILHYNYKNGPIHKGVRTAVHQAIKSVEIVGVMS